MNMIHVITISRGKFRFHDLMTERQKRQAYRVGRGPRYSLEATHSSGGQPTSCTVVVVSYIGLGLGSGLGL